jgi:predicted glycosyltransferase
LNILIDIGHPAHVHLFKNFISEARESHNVLVTVRDIPAAKVLLDKYGIGHIGHGSKKNSLAAKFFKQLGYDYRVRKLVNENRVDIGMGTSMTLAHVSRVSNMASYLFDDDDDAVQPLFKRFAHPFADFLLSPDPLRNQRQKKKHLVYPGYHELAYLHPRRFVPDPGVLTQIGLKPDDPFFVVRFNAFKAHHDVAARGLNLEQKRTLVNTLAQHGRVLITTEGRIDPEFEPFQLSISPELVHHFLFYARMFVGDSQTMTSEAAILGVPALKCNSFARQLSIPNELEDVYGLCFSFKPDRFEEMMLKLNELLAHRDLRKEWICRRNHMLKDKIDVTAMMLWLVKNHPHGIRELREHPEAFQEFK